MTQTSADPIAAAQALLEETDPETLLLKAYRLTHLIHECKGSTRGGVCDGPCTDLRAARDLITAEIIRRTSKGA